MDVIQTKFQDIYIDEMEGEILSLNKKIKSVNFKQNNMTDDFEDSMEIEEDDNSSISSMDDEDDEEFTKEEKQYLKDAENWCKYEQQHIKPNPSVDPVVEPDYDSEEGSIPDFDYWSSENDFEDL